MILHPTDYLTQILLHSRRVIDTASTILNMWMSQGMSESVSA